MNALGEVGQRVASSSHPLSTRGNAGTWLPLLGRAPGSSLTTCHSPSSPTAQSDTRRSTSKRRLAGRCGSSRTHNGITNDIPGAAQAPDECQGGLIHHPVKHHGKCDPKAQCGCKRSDLQPLCTPEQRRCQGGSHRKPSQIVAWPAMPLSVARRPRAKQRSGQIQRQRKSQSRPLPHLVRQAKTDAQAKGATTCVDPQDHHDHGQRRGHAQPAAKNELKEDVQTEGPQQFGAHGPEHIFECSAAMLAAAKQALLQCWKPPGIPPW